VWRRRWRAEVTRGDIEYKHPGTKRLTAWHVLSRGQRQSAGGLRWTQTGIGPHAVPAGAIALAAKESGGVPLKNWPVRYLARGTEVVDDQNCVLCDERQTFERITCRGPVRGQMAGVHAGTEVLFRQGRCFALVGSRGSSKVHAEVRVAENRPVGC